MSEKDLEEGATSSTNPSKISIHNRHGNPLHREENEKKWHHVERDIFYGMQWARKVTGWPHSVVAAGLVLSL